MSHWNYRTFKKVCQSTGEVYYQIHEVHYNKAGEITGVSTKPIHPQGETESQLQIDLSLMNIALDKPVLVLDEIEYGDPDWALGYVGLDDFLFSYELRSFGRLDEIPEPCRKAIADRNPRVGIGWSKEHHWFVAEVGENIHRKGGFVVKWSERHYEEDDSIISSMVPWRIWMHVCNEMPPECKKVINEQLEWDSDKKIPACGIGWNEELGWFTTELCDIVPIVTWSEKGNDNDA